MGLYSSLCVFVTVFALFESTVAAPLKGTEEESSSGGKDGGSSSALESVKNFGGKVGKQFSKCGVYLSASCKLRWQGVMFSEAGNEEGILTIKYPLFLPDYCFYPNSTLINGDIKGVEPKVGHCFQLLDVRNAARDGKVVKFNLEHRDKKIFTFTFANENDAKVFKAQVPGQH